jgi:hydrogenase small subunit
MTEPTLGEHLARRGISRRGLLKFSAAMTSLMALPPALIETFAQNLANARRPSVIWLPFQECTGCTESLTRSTQPSVEQLIFDMVSLDYQETLMAAAGHQAEKSLADTMKRNHGEYLLVIDGSVATGADGGFSCIGGVSNLEMLKEASKGAKAIICVGTCSSFGGIPQAYPNPTAAQPVSDIVTDKPIVNVPGCPPIPAVITGVLAYFVAFGRLPELDPLRRPKAFYGETIHDRCYRRPFYDQGKFAKTFDDEGARSGWCLYEVGCKGPTTYNACATVKWNGGTSFPIQSGHGCFGCSEPDFWDQPGGFYKPLAAVDWGGAATVGAAAAGGVALGATAAYFARRRQKYLAPKDDSHGSGPRDSSTQAAGAAVRTAAGTSSDKRSGGSNDMA